MYWHYHLFFNASKRFAKSSKSVSVPLAWWGVAFWVEGGTSGKFKSSSMSVGGAESLNNALGLLNFNRQTQQREQIIGFIPIRLVEVNEIKIKKMRSETNTFLVFPLSGVRFCPQLLHGSSDSLSTLLCLLSSSSCLPHI